MRCKVKFRSFVSILGAWIFLSLGCSGASVPGPAQGPDPIKGWCEDLRKSVQSLAWNIDPCKDIAWKVGGKSVKGKPLVYAEFGDPNAANTTLIFSTVHGDEIT